MQLSCAQTLAATQTQTAALGASRRTRHPPHTQPGVLIPYMLQRDCTAAVHTTHPLWPHTHHPKAPYCRADMHLATHVPLP